MCTALTLRTKDHYFGRTLDLDRFYNEEVCIMPRQFPFRFRTAGVLDRHYALIGMAAVTEGIPLFYEAANEHGLAMAGLHFPGNAWYGPAEAGKDNIAPFECIPWILCQCKDVNEAQALLSRIHLADIPFSESLPLSPLHWMLADRDRCLVIEARKQGLFIHENPAGVLTNNPPLEYQLANWERCRHLRTDNGAADFYEGPDYTAYCQGLGAVGLPGDVSSMSRFVRATFGRENALCGPEEADKLCQCFHILGSVSMIRGLCKTDHGTWDYTGYTACIHTDAGRYFYTTYENQQITCVDMHRADLEGRTLSCFPLRRTQSIFCENG